MPDGGHSAQAKELIAQEIALALMGAGTLASDMIAEGATWQKGADALIGRDAILGAVALCSGHITVDEVVTHGKAAAVSGKLRDAQGQAHLFCHMIRYTNASATQIASIVSFEHSVRNTS